VALAVCGTLAAAQSPDASPNDVILNVTALDAKGQPVTDLTSQDFEIFDEGKLQRIASFQAAATQPNNSQPTTLLLLDFLNSGLANRDYEANVVARTLEPLEQGDSIYLYLLTIRGDLYPVHALPGPNQTVERNRLGPPWTRRIQPILNSALQDVFGLRPMDDKDGGIRTAATFQALSVLGDQLTEIRGPKTFIWVTGGVPNVLAYPYGCRDVLFTSTSGSYVAGKCGNDHCILPQEKCVDYAPFSRRFTAELNRSETVFDSVEAIFESISPAGHGTARDTLEQLAGLTGGRMYVGGDAGKAIARSLEDVRARYRLAYTASPNGKYHKLRVVSTRKGVRIEAPRGYWADEPQ